MIRRVRFDNLPQQPTHNVSSQYSVPRGGMAIRAVGRCPVVWSVKRFDSMWIDGPLGKIQWSSEQNCHG